MMARLVALMDSIRPTVRRVTHTLATAASTKISSEASARAVLMLCDELGEVVDVRSDQQMEPSGSVSNVARSSARSRRIRLRLARVEIAPSAGALQRRRPGLRLPASGANDASASR